MKTGAKLLIEGLQREGVETLFGYPAVWFCRYMMNCTIHHCGTYWYGTSRQPPMQPMALHGQAAA